MPFESKAIGAMDRLHPFCAVSFSAISEQMESLVFLRLTEYRVYIHIHMCGGWYLW